jgi:hypothetical protein
MKPKDKPHYVNNADFSQAVVDYVTEANTCKEEGRPRPIVTDYIAMCFLKISEGLSHKANFVRYTYREEMVMDAVENCLKAIDNYNLETATRTGKPNAFAYFTQIAWYAFLRRIQKEKKQQEIKMKFLSESDISALIADELDNDEAIRQTQSFVDELRERIDAVKETDKAVKEFAQETRKRRRKRVDSDLSEFLDEEDL